MKNENESKRVWVYAEHCVRAGQVAMDRWEDFGNDPDSDDYEAWTLDDALYVIGLGDRARPARRRCAASVVAYFRDELPKNQKEQEGKMNDLEIKEALASHTEWLKSNGKSGRRANFARANLAGANFAGAKLTGANFAGANLTRANFAGANLAGASFAGAKLTRANFTGANFARANLTEAKFTGAGLARANFTEANFTGACFARANLTEAEFTGAGLAWASFTGAKLTGTCLDTANKPNGDVDGFTMAGEYVVGYRTSHQPVMGGPSYKVGKAYTAPWFSTADTPCHPGLYLRPEHEPGDIIVLARADEVHCAGDKWRCKRFIVVGKESDSTSGAWPN